MSDHDMSEETQQEIIHYDMSEDMNDETIDEMHQINKKDTTHKKNKKTPQEINNELTKEDFYNSESIRTLLSTVTFQDPQGNEISGSFQEVSSIYFEFPIMKDPKRLCKVWLSRQANTTPFEIAVTGGNEYHGVHYNREPDDYICPFFKYETHNEDDLDHLDISQEILRSVEFHDDYAQIQIVDRINIPLSIMDEHFTLSINIDKDFKYMYFSIIKDGDLMFLHDSYSYDNKTTKESVKQCNDLSMKMGDLEISPTTTQ